MYAEWAPKSSRSLRKEAFFGQESILLAEGADNWHNCAMIKGYITAGVTVVVDKWA